MINALKIKCEINDTAVMYGKTEHGPEEYVKKTTTRPKRRLQPTSTNGS